MREKCPLRSLISRIGLILRISVQMQENKDQNNSEYR